MVETCIVFIIFFSQFCVFLRVYVLVLRLSQFRLVNLTIFLTLFFDLKLYCLRWKGSTILEPIYYIISPRTLFYHLNKIIVPVILSILMSKTYNLYVYATIRIDSCYLITHSTLSPNNIFEVLFNIYNTSLCISCHYIFNEIKDTELNEDIVTCLQIYWQKAEVNRSACVCVPQYNFYTFNCK